MRPSIRTKLFSMCALACFGLAGVVFFIVWRLEVSMTLTSRVIEVRTPMVRYGSEALDGLNASVACVRAFMQRRDEKFKTERRRLWEDVIEPAMQGMTAIACRTPANTDSSGLVEIKKICSEVLATQEEIEAVCHTPENTPAQKIFLEEAAPAASAMIGALSALITDELQLDTKDVHKHTLKQAVEARDEVMNCVVNLRAFLSGGEEKYRAATLTSLASAAALLDKIDHEKAMLRPPQIAALDRFAAALKRFHPLPGKIFRIRDDDQWNIAARLLETQVSPQLAELRSRISKIVDRHQADMSGESRTVRDSIASLKTLLWIFLGCGISCSGVVAFSTIRSIIRPLEAVAASARSLAAGNIAENVNITGAVEFKQINASFNSLSSALRDKADIAAKIAEGDLSVNVQLASPADRLGHNLALIIETVRHIRQSIEPLFVDGASANVNDAHPYGAVSRAVEDSLATMRSAVHDATSVLQYLASGDFTARFPHRVRNNGKKRDGADNEGDGEFALIKEVLNEAVGILDVEFSRMAAHSTHIAELSENIHGECKTLEQIAALHVETAERASGLVDEINAHGAKHDALVGNAITLIDGMMTQSRKQAESLARLTDGLSHFQTGAEAATYLLRTLNDIAMSAKMLSINAAIEAAHAGEAGKSFAVVASELGELARRSAAAAQNSEDAVTAVDQFAQLGSGMGNDLARHGAEIGQQLQNVSTMLAETSATSRIHKQEIGSLQKIIHEVHELGNKTEKQITSITNGAAEMREASAALHNDFARFRFTMADDENSILESDRSDDKATAGLSITAPNSRMIEASHAPHKNGLTHHPENGFTFSLEEASAQLNADFDGINENLKNDDVVVHANGKANGSPQNGDSRDRVSQYVLAETD